MWFEGDLLVSVNTLLSIAFLSGSGSLQVACACDYYARGCTHKLNSDGNRFERVLAHDVARLRNR